MNAHRTVFMYAILFITVVVIDFVLQLHSSFPCACCTQRCHMDGESSSFQYFMCNPCSASLIIVWNYFWFGPINCLIIIALLRRIRARCLFSSLLLTRVIFHSNRCYISDGRSENTISVVIYDKLWKITSIEKKKEGRHLARVLWGRYHDEQAVGRTKPEITSHNTKVGSIWIPP